MTDQALDVALFQTAASVENAIVNAYDVVLGLPVLSGDKANAVLKALLTTARGQHNDHASACNDMAGKLGGKPQPNANPNLAQLLNRARPGLTDIGPVIDMALQLELTSAQTHQNAVGLAIDLNARRLAAMILAVEGQHVGLLQVAKALVGARAPDLLVADGGTRDRTPGDAVKAGFPDSFSKTDQARPSAEGAVR